jgi:hypothetical protein
MRVWMLAEAFRLTGDSDCPQPWALPCVDRKTALRELKQCVTERIAEVYEGSDDEYDLDEKAGEVLRDWRPQGGRGSRVYEWDGADRQIQWRVYPCEVMGTPFDPRRDLRPCPFCGGEARVLHGGLRFMAAVECPECRGRIDRISEGDPVSEARAAWNRRAGDKIAKKPKGKGNKPC